MSVVAAIDLSESSATVVTAETTVSGVVKLRQRHVLDLTEAREGNLTQILSESIDGTVGVLSDCLPLYEQLSLPFTDRKRVIQVLPLQLEDLLPFDVGAFVLDTAVSQTLPSGETLHISVLVKEEQIAKSLATLDEFSADPRFLTTRAGALAALYHFITPQPENIALLALSNDAVSLAVFVGGKLNLLRDIPFLPEQGNIRQSTAQLKRVWAEIQLSIARVEAQQQLALNPIFIVGRNSALEQLARRSKLPFQHLDLNLVVTSSGDNPVDANSVPWAVCALLANSLTEKERKVPLLDLRQGKYAFRRSWSTLTSTIREEVFPFALLLGCVVIWIASELLSSQILLNNVNSSIREAIAETFPGQSIPSGRELEFLEERLGELESELAGLGSLTAVSQLDSLKEFSAAVRSVPGTNVENLKLGAGTLAATGSVPDIPAVGRLDTALKAQPTKFCEATVNSEGRVSGSSRAKFTAEIKLCR